MTYTLTFQKSAKLAATTVEVESLAEASASYCSRRDVSGEGCSTFPFAALTGPEGDMLVSYNGRVWAKEDEGETGELLFDPAKHGTSDFDVEGLRMAAEFFAADDETPEAERARNAIEQVIAVARPRSERGLIYVHRNGEDIKEAEGFSDIEQAARHILLHDMQACGFEKDRHGEYVPWQMPHRGDIKYWRAAAAPTIKEASEGVVSVASTEWLVMTEAYYTDMMATLCDRCGAVLDDDGGVGCPSGQHVCQDCFDAGAV